MSAQTITSSNLFGHRVGSAPPRRSPAHKIHRRKTQSRFFVHGNLKIDFPRAEVWKDEKPVYLSATEYRLLIQFAHNISRVLTAEELLVAVWGAQYRDDKEILWVSIARLRQKLEDNPHEPQHIVTRSGLGYLMPPSEKE